MWVWGGVVFVIVEEVPDGEWDQLWGVCWFDKEDNKDGITSNEQCIEEGYKWVIVIVIVVRGIAIVKLTTIIWW